VTIAPASPRTVIGDPADPARVVSIGCVYVPAATFTMSPGCATSSPSWIAPNGAPALPSPVPPLATYQSCAIASDGTSSTHAAAIRIHVASPDCRPCAITDS
jgi:hypothetical protein